MQCIKYLTIRIQELWEHRQTTSRMKKRPEIRLCTNFRKVDDPFADEELSDDQRSLFDIKAQAEAASQQSSRVGNIDSSSELTLKVPDKFGAHARKASDNIQGVPPMTGDGI